MSETKKRNRVQCNDCDEEIESNNIKRHRERNHGVKTCSSCNETFRSYTTLNQHKKTCRVRIAANYCTSMHTFHSKTSAIGNRFQTFDIGFEKDEDYETTITQSLIPIKEVLIASLKNLKTLKFYICYEIQMTKELESNYTTTSHFHTSTKSLYQTSKIEEILEACKSKVFTSIETFNRRGSGWVFTDIVDIELYVAQYQPTAGGSYIELPPLLKKKSSLLNIKNNDNQCLKWCLLAALFPKSDRDDHQCRTKSYKEHEDQLEFAGVRWPATLIEIPKVEKLNQIRINVYGFDDELNTGVFPLYISKSRESRVISLLLINNDINQHYVLIKSLDGLLRGKTKYTSGMKHCERCLQGFWRKEVLDSHLVECNQFKTQRIRMPKDTHIKFTNYRKQIKAPIIIVADFECLLKPVLDESTSRTTTVNKHIPSGFAYKVVSYIPEYNKPTVVYRGEGCEDVFVVELLREHEKALELLETDLPITISKQEEQQFEFATICHICDKPLSDDKVRDHNHYTGKYVGAAHNSCNLNFHLKKSKRIPVVIHNLKNYDSHLFIRSLAKFSDTSSIKVIASTTEKFTTIKTPEFSFIDSCQHLPDSLDNLVSNLKTKGVHNFKTLAEEYPDEDSFNLLLGKGVYPYSYMDSWEKFDEALPERECFYNELTDRELSEQDYERVQRIFNHFNLRNLGELQDLYVKQDVLLLADVVQNFREMCLSSYKLDPLHYPTAPSLSWDACLRKTGAELELLTDVDMYMMLEKSIRGGLTMITHRMVTANNECLKEYNQNEEKVSLFYTDANNLYGYSMCDNLPYDGFEWVNPGEIDISELNKFDLEGEKGMILEVDLKIPESIHDFTSDYPLAPEKLLIEDHLISPVSKDFLNKNGVVVNGVKKPLKHNVRVKLTPNLFNKQHYVVHIKNLMYYLQKGAEITKIHRIIRFNQQKWLKVYVDFNTEKRCLAVSDFEKSFFKLLINSIFGKLMENVRKYKNVHLISSGRQHRLYTSKPQFKRFKIHSEDLVMVELEQTNVTLNKPIYCGFTVLELSKLHMYKFHYEVMKPRFEGLKLCFTDTDSLLYAVATDNFYRDIECIKDEFDFSNYPKNHPLYSVANKAVPGKFKDETASFAIKEFIGLRAKLYSILLDQPIVTSGKNIIEKRATAGVKTSVAAKYLQHNMFREVFQHQNRMDITQQLFVSENHQIFTKNKTRIGLSAFDDKRYILSDLKTTLPYGHYSLNT